MNASPSPVVEEGAAVAVSRRLEPTQNPMAARRVIRRETFDGVADDAVTIDSSDRQRRRYLLTTDAGAPVLLDLAAPADLREGDVLALSDGRHVVVHAKAEALLRVTPATPRIAWHLGNRHLDVEIAADALYIRQDHVIAAMLAGLGAQAEPVSRPFQPESGAYAYAHAHAHG